jgi:hypothetical protein
MGVCVAPAVDACVPPQPVVPAPAVAPPPTQVFSLPSLDEIEADELASVLLRKSTAGRKHPVLPRPPSNSTAGEERKFDAEATLPVGSMKPEVI